MKINIKIMFIIILLLICNSITSSSINIELNENIKKSNKVYLDLEPGDIVWRWVDANIFPLLQFFMHPLMVTNVIEDEFEFIESNGAKNVWIRTETAEWVTDNNIFDFVYRIKDDIASSSNIQNAINFAKSQEGKKFVPLYDIYTGLFHVKNSDPNDPNDLLSDSWYCTELIWAAYYNQGINIESTIIEEVILPIDFHLSPIFDKVNLQNY
jgi:hypothetical protein